MTALFQDGNDSQVTIPDNALETLVGDGKKFKDVEALAKGKFESDIFIDTLKTEGRSKDAEIQRLQDELKTRVTMQEFIDKVNERGLPDDQPHDPSRTQKVQEVDIDKLLDNKLQQLSKKAQAEQNISSVQAELDKVWGANAKAKLRERAKELNISQEFLQSVAETSPKAFLELIKPVSNTTNDNYVPASTVSVSTPPVGQRNQAWYEKEMKKDKKLRLDPTFQKQMYRDAMKMGASFFDK